MQSAKRSNTPEDRDFNVRRLEQLKRQLAECEQARIAAQTAEHRLHLFANSVEDYAFITLDQENRVIGWNRGAQRMLGYDEASILGKPGSVFFTLEDRDRGITLANWLWLAPKAALKMSAGTYARMGAGFGAPA